MVRNQNAGNRRAGQQTGGMINKLPVVGPLVDKIPVLSHISSAYPLTTAVMTAALVTDVHPMDVLSAPVQMLPNMELIHPLDILEGPLSLFDMEIPHPLDLLRLPLDVLKGVASELKIPGRSKLTNKQQVAGAIVQHLGAMQQGN